MIFVFGLVEMTIGMLIGYLIAKSIFKKRTDEIVNKVIDDTIHTMVKKGFINEEKVHQEFFKTPFGKFFQDLEEMRKKYDDTTSDSNRDCRGQNCE